MEATVERHLAEILGISKDEANKIWNATEKALANSIAEDPELRLRGFGTFVVVDRPAQTIKHPVTKQEYKIPAYKTVDFRPGSELTETVNKATETES